MNNEKTEKRPVVSSVEAGTKRKGGSGMAEESKENFQSRNVGGTKRQKLYPDNPAVTMLKDQIERECKIRDGAAKLQQAAKNPWQGMEASKGLFVSNAKIIALMKELQQVQSRQDWTASKNTGNEGEIHPCMTKIAISEIRIPLEWKQFEQAKGKSDSHKIGVFCLFRLGNQVMDTHSIAEVDRSTMDISFTDCIIFPEQVDKDFVLEAEVYCSSSTTSDTSSTPSTPLTPMKMLRKIKKDWNIDSPLSHSSSSSSLSSAATYVPSMQAVNPSHHFTLAGHAHFTLSDVACSCRTYTLTRGAVGSSGTASTSSACDQPLLPLWGQICCNLMAQPDCATNPRITGFINVQQKVTGLPAWTRLWCVMRQNHMRCWVYPEDVGMKMPCQTIDLTSLMEVENAPRLTMRRPNTIIVKDNNKEQYVSFESKEERIEWTIAIQQAIVDQKVWGDSCGYIISKPASKFYARDNDNSPLPFSGNVGFNRGLHSETVI